MQRRPDFLEAPITIIPVFIDSAAPTTQSSVSKMSTQKPFTAHSPTHHRPFTAHSPTLHRAFTEHSQSTHRALTEHSQSIHRHLTEHSRSTHRQFTAHSQTFHRTEPILQTQRTLKHENDTSSWLKNTQAKVIDFDHLGALFRSGAPDSDFVIY